MSDNQQNDDDMHDEDTLVPQQQEVQVYLNRKNDIVFKRDIIEFEFASSQEKDVFIVIPRLYVPALIDRLKALMEQSS